MSLLRTLLLFLCLLPPALAGVVTLPARAVDYQPEVHAWARVETLAPLTLRMPLAARVAALNARPGETVAAGAPLVRLGGPQMAGQLAAARARVAAAAQELAAAQQSAASVARTFPALTNRRALAAARAALAAAAGRLAQARADEQALRAQTWLASPLPAVVSSVSAAPGADLPAGAALLTLLPQGRLWLRAEVFGRLPLAPGTAARFVSADGQTVTVRLADELPARAANGARVVNFAPRRAAPHWQAGESGEVVIAGAPQPAVAVPAGALILDAGRWYVLSAAAGKLTALRVKPGPARGDEVLILAGLAPATPVVVRQAYLLYHRDFAAHYTPPD